MGENLKKVMIALVNKHVKHYKSDIQFDLELINEEEQQVYYWLIRHSGTSMIPENKAKSKIGNGLLYLEYYKNREGKKLYKIRVDKKDKGAFYGDIEEVPYCETIERLKREAVLPKAITYYYGGEELTVNIDENIDIEKFSLYYTFQNAVNHRPNTNFSTYKYTY